MREVLQQDSLLPIDVLKSQSVNSVSDYLLNATALSLSSYPDPFTETLTLDVTLDTASDVRVDITSIEGGRAFTALDRAMGPGRHAVTIMPDLPSGTYVATLIAGTRRTSRIVHCAR
jgi:hypothetical protein